MKLLALSMVNFQWDTPSKLPIDQKFLKCFGTYMSHQLTNNYVWWKLKVSSFQLTPNHHPKHSGQMAINAFKPKGDPWIPHC